MNIIALLNLSSFLVSLVALGYSGYSDIRKREVSNWVWATYLPVGVAILCLRLIFDTQVMTISLISIVATSALSFLMFYVGLFGGADCKAFVCLSIALPTRPFPPQILSNLVNPFFPLTVFYTAYLFSISTIVYTIVNNLNWKYMRKRELFRGLDEESPFKRGMALLTGFKTDFESLKQRVYLYPMEETLRIDGMPHKRLKFFANAEADRNELVHRLAESLNENEKEQVWVTPGIPLLFFTWIALALTAFAGDILLSVVWLLFRMF